MRDYKRRKRTFYHNKSIMIIKISIHHKIIKNHNSQILKSIYKRNNLLPLLNNKRYLNNKINNRITLSNSKLNNKCSKSNNNKPPNNSNNNSSSNISSNKSKVKLTLIMLTIVKHFHNPKIPLLLKLKNPLIQVRLHNN